MSTLRDRILNSSLDDLVDGAERGEIDPNELWDETLNSLDRTTAILRKTNETQGAATAYLEGKLPALRERQDQIDAMIEQWRVELAAAGLLPDAPRHAPARAI
jgi:hypothetical protein